MKALKTSIIACAALLSLGSCDFLDKEPPAMCMPDRKPKASRHTGRG